MQITPIHVSVMRNNMTKSNVKQNNDVSFKGAVPQGVADDFLSMFKKFQRNTLDLVQANMRKTCIAEFVDTGALRKGSVRADLPQTIKGLKKARRQDVKALRKTAGSMDRTVNGLFGAKPFKKAVNNHNDDLNKAVKLSNKGIAQDYNGFSSWQDGVYKEIAQKINLVSDGAAPVKEPKVSQKALEAFFAEA